MKRTIRTRGGRHAVSSALGTAIKPSVRSPAPVEHDAEAARLKRLSSLVRWVSGSEAPNRKESGSPTPVSPRQMNNEERLTDAIESITEGFALWDADDRLILCNAKFRDFYPSMAPTLIPGVSYEHAAGKRRHRADGPRGGTREEHLSDGRWLLATDHPTSDGGRVCVRADITQRKHAEQAIRRSRATVQSMIDAVDDLIAMVNADGVILAINRSGAEGFGRRPRDLVGRSLPEQFEPGPAGQLRDIIASVLAGERRMDAEFGWRDRCLHLGAHPVMNETGAPAAVSIFSRDITERVRAEEEARERQHQLMRYMRIATIGEMSAALAHELNQPISAIVNYCNGSLRRLASGRWNVEDLREAIDETYGEAKRARDIIQNVSRFVRKAPQRRETVEIGTLFESIGNLIRKDLKRHGIALVVDLAAPATAVNVNIVEVEQTLLNLLRNAMESIAEADPPERRIVVRGTVDGGVLHVTVRDTGAGFSRETADRAFDPFFTSKAEGMGMGLAICRGIVADHGGRIWAEPRDSLSTPGGAIHLTLPISEANNAAA